MTRISCLPCVCLFCLPLFQTMLVNFFSALPFALSSGATQKMPAAFRCCFLSSPLFLGCFYYGRTPHMGCAAAWCAIVPPWPPALDTPCSTSPPNPHATPPWQSPFSVCAFFFLGGGIFYGRKSGVWRAPTLPQIETTTPSTCQIRFRSTIAMHVHRRFLENSPDTVKCISDGRNYCQTHQHARFARTFMIINLGASLADD